MVLDLSENKVNLPLHTEGKSAPFLSEWVPTQSQVVLHRGYVIKALASFLKGESDLLLTNDKGVGVRMMSKGEFVMVDYGVKTNGSEKGVWLKPNAYFEQQKQKKVAEKMANQRVISVPKSKKREGLVL